MPKKINHEERKQLILRTALQVFARHGYRETNLSLIALECGLSRTTVYQYFSSVDDVLAFAVKRMSQTMFEKYASWQDNKDSIGLLKCICTDILDNADRHAEEIANFIAIMKDLELNIQGTVHRRTAKLNLLLARLIRSGQASGQIKKCSANDCVTKIIIFIESYCFQLTFFEKQTATVREMLDSFLTSLANPEK